MNTNSAYYESVCSWEIFPCGSGKRTVCRSDHVQTIWNQKLNCSDLSALRSSFPVAVYTLLGKYSPFMKPQDQVLSVLFCTFLSSSHLSLRPLLFQLSVLFTDRSSCLKSWIYKPQLLPRFFSFYYVTCHVCLKEHSSGESLFRCCIKYFLKYR